MKCETCAGEMDAFFTREGLSSEEACPTCDPGKFASRTQCGGCGEYILTEYFDEFYHAGPELECSECSHPYPPDQLVDGLCSPCFADAAAGKNYMSSAVETVNCFRCGDVVLPSDGSGDMCPSCVAEHNEHAFTFGASDW